MNRLRKLSLVAIACAPLGACATTVGTVAGPVTANISFFEHTEGTPDWARIFAVPFVAMTGPLIGMVNGAQADLGFAANGRYGAPGYRPFGSVWDPANPEWGRPAPNEFLERRRP
jgi:hypothetical protein